MRKVVNALIPGAQPLPSAVNWITRAIVGLFSAWYGGLWVGGDIELSAEGLRFVPNQANRDVHVQLSDVHIPLAEIRAVRDEFGWVTRIVAVQHTRGVFKFRCFGASEIAAQIAKAARGGGNGA